MIYFYMADTLTIFVESVFCCTMITKALKARLVSSFDSSNITIIPPALSYFFFPQDEGAQGRASGILAVRLEHNFPPCTYILTEGKYLLASFACNYNTARLGHCRSDPNNNFAWIQTQLFSLIEYYCQTSGLEGRDWLLKWFFDFSCMYILNGIHGCFPSDVSLMPVSVLILN